jgi:hypothetical protein
MVTFRREFSALLSTTVLFGLGGCADQLTSNDETVISEDPRIDEPPYPIDEETIKNYSSDKKAQQNWNSRYLGEEMPTQPSVEFERLDIPIGFVTSDTFNLARHVEDLNAAYLAVVIKNKSEITDIFKTDEMDKQRRQTLENINFESTALILVETGFGSSSIKHRWKRIEKGKNSVHLHGYYTKPLTRNSDLDTRFSVLRVNQPDDFEFARVSLTTNVDERVHFNSTEGIVSL